MNKVVYNLEDVRELVKQLKEHRPTIEITIEEEFNSLFQTIPGIELPTDFYACDSYVDETDCEDDGEPITDCGYYGDTEYKFNINKPTYDDKITWTGIGKYDLDMYISHIEDFIKDGGEGDSNFEYDGFELYLQNLIYNGEIEGLTCADQIEEHSYIIADSLIMHYGGLKIVGWNGINEIDYQDTSFKIIEN